MPPAISSGMPAALRTGAAWIAIHNSRSAFVEMALTGIASVLASGLTIDRFGPFLFPSPLVGLLIVPVVAGTAVGTAAYAEVDVRLPDPLRARFARLLWVLVWMILVAAAATPGLLVSDANTQLGFPVIRNVLLFVSLTLPLVTEGWPHLLWIPSVLLTLSAAVFGRSEVDDSWLWWAFMFDPKTSGTEVAAVAVLALLALAHYGFRPRGRLA